MRDKHEEQTELEFNAQMVKLFSILVALTSMLGTTDVVQIMFHYVCLQCCLDLSSQVLKLQGCGEELPFLNPSTDSQCQHDTNENL